MDFNNINYHLSNTHINKRFKSFHLDFLDKNYDSDTQTILNYDDEYDEIPNLYNKKEKIEKNKKFQNKMKRKNIHKKKSKNRNNSFDKNLVDKSLKNLIEIKTDDKKGILDILMKKDLIIKKEPDKNEIIKEKNRNKFSYVESKTKPNLSSRPPNTYGRKGFQIEIEEGNPEFIKDMNYAKFKLKKRIKKENELVADLLFNGTDNMSNTRKSISRKEIGEKIKNALDRKKQKLQKIEWQIFEQQKLEQTFTPSIIHSKKEETKRNFDIFLKDQEAFQKKIKIKNRNLLMKSQSEEQLLYVGQPVINKKSEDIAKKLDVDKNVYLRLYKRDTYDKFKDRKLGNKLLEQTTKNNTNTNTNSPNSKNSKSKKDKYSHVQSRINIWDKNKKEKDNSKKKVLTKRTKSSSDFYSDKKIFNYSDISNNRMVWNKFSKKFEKILENILISDNKNGSNGTNKNINNLNLNDELDENQYYDLLYNLGMVNYIKGKENDKTKLKEVNINKKGNQLNKNLIIETNSFNTKEKLLVKYSFNILKLGKNKIKTSNLKIFLCFVLNLHNYYFYHEYKLNHNPQELKKLYSLDKYKKEEIPLAMIKKYNEELLSTIDKSNHNNTKYFYINKNDNNKIVITLDNYTSIKKDFSLLNFNYRNHKIKNIPKSILELEKYNFYRKVYPQINEGLNATTRSSYNNNENKSQNKIKNMEYIDKLLLQEKRRKAKNSKKKEELENKKILECSFKPKINLKFPSYINFKKEKLEKYTKFINKKNTDKKTFSRLEEMYEEGTKTMKGRKDRSKVEIELEEQKHECTFQPHLYTSTNQKKSKDNIIIDIYNEKQYKSLYERLKQGRLNKMVRDSSNDRYELSDELKKYVKDYKENNFINIQDYYNKTDSSYYYNNKNMYINENKNTEENIMGNCNLCIDIIDDNKKKNNKNENANINKDINNNGNKIININLENKDKQNIEPKIEESEIKTKEPLLIIDINIKEGVNKKIFVYAGDTSKSLANQIAKENNLDIDTQKKLENIIHEQMVKPLSKIDEENFSGSDKN